MCPFLSLVLLNVHYPQLESVLSNILGTIVQVQNKSGLEVEIFFNNLYMHFSASYFCSTKIVEISKLRKCPLHIVPN